MGAVTVHHDYHLQVLYTHFQGLEKSIYRSQILDNFFARAVILPRSFVGYGSSIKAGAVTSILSRFRWLFLIQFVYKYDVWLSQRPIHPVSQINSTNKNGHTAYARR